MASFEDLLKERQKRDAELYVDPAKTPVEGLPEYTENPVQDMIDKANEEAKYQQAIAAEAKARKLAEKNDQDELADFQMSEEERARTEGIRQATKDPTVKVDESEMQAQDRVSNILQSLREAREQERTDIGAASEKRRASDLLAQMVSGAERIGKGLAGRGLVELKPDDTAAKAMRESANKEFQVQQKLAENVRKTAEMEADILSKAGASELNRKLIAAKIAKLTSDASKKTELSDDPNSEASKREQALWEKKGLGDMTGFSEKRLQDMSKNLARKITRPIDREREDRLKEKQTWQIDEKDEVSDKQLEDISKLNTLQDMTSRIKDLKQKVNTGVYSQASHLAGKYMPGDFQDEDQAGLTALVGTNLADYVKTISGAAVSEEEAQRLARNIPEMGDDDKVFNRKLKEFDKTLSDLLNKRQVNMKKYQGKTIPGMEDAPKSNEVRRKTKDGKTAIFNAETKDFIRYE